MFKQIESFKNWILESKMTWANGNVAKEIFRNHEGHTLTKIWHKNGDLHAISFQKKFAIRSTWKMMFWSSGYIYFFIYLGGWKTIELIIGKWK